MDFQVEMDADTSQYIKGELVNQEQSSTNQHLLSILSSYVLMVTQESHPQ